MRTTKNTPYFEFPTKKSSLSHINPEKVELTKIKIFDGIDFLITLKLDKNKLQILGDNQKDKEIKMIEIDRLEAKDFI